MTGNKAGLLIIQMPLQKPSACKHIFKISDYEFHVFMNLIRQFPDIAIFPLTKNLHIGVESLNSASYAAPPSKDREPGRRKHQKRSGHHNLGNPECSGKKRRDDKKHHGCGKHTACDRPKHGGKRPSHLYAGGPAVQNRKLLSAFGTILTVIPESRRRFAPRLVFLCISDIS